jgi:hypothetical protein
MEITQPQKLVSRLTEKDVQQQLHAIVGGDMEVVTPVGNIDILTDTELIEVKEAKAWKNAIGQLITYGYYYPNHQKRLHLFGRCHHSALILIRQHCDLNNILVTY